MYVDLADERLKLRVHRPKPDIIRVTIEIPADDDAYAERVRNAFAEFFQPRIRPVTYYLVGMEKARLEAGLSFRQLARQIKMPALDLEWLETRECVATREDAIKLAEFFGTPFGDFAINSRRRDDVNDKENDDV